MQPLPPFQEQDMIKPMSERADWNRLPVDNPARRRRERVSFLLSLAIIAAVFIAGVLVGWGVDHAHGS